MNEKEKIFDLIIKNPKHYSKMVKANKELCDWVETNSTTPAQLFPIKIYSAIHNNSGICKNNKQKRFIGINDGFGFCGKSSICECANESVSAKVAEAKNKRTKEQIELENEKRVKTSLLKYGVNNNGKLANAKNAHSTLYKNKEKVNQITEKIKQTKLVNHGNEKYNNRLKAIETCKTLYGVENTWLLNQHYQNPNLIKLKNKELLQELFPAKSVEEISDELGVHKQTVYYYAGLHGLREPYKSTFEQEITTFLVNHGITNIVTNKRNIIGKELDIYLPDFNLAIEYNGEYWHHDKVPHITKHYHYDKFMLCENNNIKLFTIFGNSWQEKKNIWKEKILSSIGLASRRIYARKTKIVQISSKDTKEFLNKHHIQGYSASKYCYGLVYNDELVAVMTFSDKRVGIGKNRGEGSFELVRYATSCSVVGGASKLLTHFIKSQTPKIIYSYSDNQYSHGDLYKLLDFELEKISKCGYWYYDPVKHRSYHRYNFTKHKLVSMGYDVNKTEKQIMNELGFLRIYDCGSKTWVLKL